MTPDSKLWQMYGWPREWAERPLNKKEVVELQEKQGWILYWHNDVLFRRDYRIRGVLQNPPLDTAIVGDSFGTHDSPKLRYWYAMMDFVPEFDSFIPIDDGRDRYKFPRREAKRIKRFAADYNLHISEAVSLLQLSFIEQTVFVKGDFKYSIESVLYPVFNMCPEDGFSPPRFPFTGNVLMIGDGVDTAQSRLLSEA